MTEEFLLQRRPTWAEINLDNLAHNIRQIRKRLKPGINLMAVVKADGYGHGAEEVARLALTEGCQWLGVAHPEEGVALRRQGIEAPILILGPDLISSLPLYFQYDLIPSLSCWEWAQAFSQEAVKQDKVLNVHIKIDTGMGRLGFLYFTDPVDTIKKIASLPGLKIQGLYTHFSSADEPDATFTLEQWQRFESILTACQRKGIKIEMSHAANSAGILYYPCSHAALVRLGISLYGYFPSQSLTVAGVDLKPVLALKSRLAFLKNVPPRYPVSYGRTFYTRHHAVLATVPIGYADGLNRRLSNSGFALLRGKKVPIVGRICMDQTVLDVTAVRDACLGDEVVFYGNQGDETISVDDVAQQLNTVSYEVLCAVGKRVPRVYIRGGTVWKVRP